MAGGQASGKAVVEYASRVDQGTRKRPAGGRVIAPLRAASPRDNSPVPGNDFQMASPAVGQTPELGTDRLTLEPLRAAHADELAPQLDDEDLHTFIGGRPSTADELRARYASWEAGLSPDGTERWLNWVVRRRDTKGAIGTVQATVTSEGTTAEVAWTIATAHQRLGYAREAAGAMVGWLRDHGVTTVIAHVHPQHRASEAVARAIGLRPTTIAVDGETQWSSVA